MGLALLSNMDATNEYPSVGWWNWIEEKARGMTIQGLDFSARDAYAAAQCRNSNELRYLDEVNVFTNELARRRRAAEK